MDQQELKEKQFFFEAVKNMKNYEYDTLIIVDDLLSPISKGMSESTLEEVEMLLVEAIKSKKLTGLIFNRLPDGDYTREEESGAIYFKRIPNDLCG